MPDEIDFEGYVARFTQALESGEIQVPAPREELGQRMRFEVAGTDDPQALGPEAFAQHGPLDEADPEALLAAQAASFAGDPAAMGTMSDNAVLGLVLAGRKLAARGAAIQQQAIAEYARRSLPAQGTKPSRHGFKQFSADELSWQLDVNHNQAEAAMVAAREAVRRLPKLCGLLWNGRISEYQLRIITSGTGCLADEDAAEADMILAGAVPGLTPGQTRSLVRRVVLLIDPEAAKERKREGAKRARVERFQEDSGNAALCGRDLPTDAVLASYQHIDAQARKLKAAGYNEDLELLRAAVYLALTTGRDPVTMIAALKTNAGDAIPVPTREPADREDSTDDGNGDDGNGGDGNGGDGNGGRGPQEPRNPRGPTGGQAATTRATEGSPHGTEGTGAAPFAAFINLLVPAGALLGNGTAPGEIPGHGPVDPQTTRDLVQIASAHPGTRWCVTTIGEDGTAQEHGCASGQHRWTPSAACGNPSTQRTGGGNRDGPDQPPDPASVPGEDEEQLAAQGFLAWLQVKLAPVANGDQHCDHTHCTDKYEVPRRLKHLIKARKATCVAPCCNWPAADGDADHTVPWPDGPTCQENLGAPCRYHHRNKQASDWKLEQTQPGVFEWRGPSGRSRTTTPARYLT
jgi:hypothetical protein